jgi:uncharacterized membrane protein
MGILKGEPFMERLNIIIGVANIICCLLYIAVSIPMITGSVKMNWIYGARFPKSFESEENWYKINKYTGKRLVFWSIPLFIIGVASFFIPMEEDSVIAIVLAFAPLIVIIPTIEGFMYSKRL